MSNEQKDETGQTTQSLIAAVLTDHHWRHTRETHCACGFRTPLAQLAVEGYIEHVAALVADALVARDVRRIAALRADCEARATREIEGALDDYVDCTCGHPNADHVVGACPFLGCGCGVMDDDSDVVQPPGASA